MRIILSTRDHKIQKVEKSEENDASSNNNKTKSNLKKQKSPGVLL